MKATGVNSFTKSQLKKLMDEGYTAEEISSQIQVELKSVKAWMEHFGADSEPSVGPTMKSSKEDILAFAEQNDIDVDDTDTKEALLETIAAAREE